jgi:hypothetical protein
VVIMYFLGNNPYSECAVKLKGAELDGKLLPIAL